MLLLLVLTLTKGRGYRLGGRSETSMDIPDESAPALVAMLWEARTSSARAVPATLLDLVQRGVLALEPVPSGEPGHDPAEARLPLPPHRAARQGAARPRARPRLLLFRDAVSEGR